MLRLELLRAIDRIADSLKPAVETLNSAFSSDVRKLPVTAVLNVFHSLKRDEMTFGQAERELIRILRIEPLFNEQFWETFVTDDKKPIVPMRRVYNNARNAVDLLPLFGRMLQRDYNVVGGASSKGPQAEGGAESLVSMSLPENDRHRSSPQ